MDKRIVLTIVFFIIYIIVLLIISSPEKKEIKEIYSLHHFYNDCLLYPGGFNFSKLESSIKTYNVDPIWLSGYRLIQSKNHQSYVEYFYIIRKKK